MPRRNNAKDIYKRNVEGYAYSDIEINSFFVAANSRDKIEYHIMKNINGHEVATNILVNKQKAFLKDSKGRMVVEMPACDSSGSSSPIFNHLRQQFNFLDHISDKEKYPLKILFPYRLTAWHWNAGEIIINKDDRGNYKIEGRAYDSYGRGNLEREIQEQIRNFFDQHQSFKNKSNISFHQTQVEPVQTGVACGLYAARAIHNLKTKEVDQIWDSIFTTTLGGKRQKSEQTLRNEDSQLIEQYNPTALNSFCKEYDRARPIDQKASKNTESEEKQLARKIIGEINKLGLSSDQKESLADLLALTEGSEYAIGMLYNLLFDQIGLIDEKLCDILFSKNDQGKRNEAKFTFGAINIVCEEYKKSSQGFDKNESSYQDLFMEIVTFLTGFIENSYAKALQDILKNQNIAKEDEEAKQKSIKEYYDASNIYIEEYLSKRGLDEEKKEYFKKYFTSELDRVQEKIFPSKQSQISSLKIANNFLIEDKKIGGFFTNIINDKNSKLSTKSHQLIKIQEKKENDSQLEESLKNAKSEIYVLSFVEEKEGNKKNSNKKYKAVILKSEAKQFLDSSKKDEKNKDEEKIVNYYEGSVFKALNAAREKASKFLKSRDFEDSFLDQNISLIVKTAHKVGGVGQREEKFKKKLAEGFKTEDRSIDLNQLEDLVKAAKIFSRAFQDATKEAGILTGNQSAKKIVGLRLKRLPEEIVEKCCSKIPSATTSSKNYSPLKENKLNTSYSSKQNE